MATKWNDAKQTYPPKDSEDKTANKSIRVLVFIDVKNHPNFAEYSHYIKFGYYNYNLNEWRVEGMNFDAVMLWAEIPALTGPMKRMIRIAKQKF